MKIEILITNVLSDIEIKEIHKMQKCVKTGVKYKNMKLISYELFDSGTGRGMPFDAIKFIGTTFD